MVSPPTRSLRILGREPSAWIATVGAVLVALAALGMPFLTAGQAVAATALIAMVILALTTKPVAPALVTGVVTACAAVLASYSMELSDSAVAAIAAATLAVFALITRQQVAPKDTLVTRS